MKQSRLYLHTSNRMEDLANMLARQLSARAGGDPFHAETIMVQSRGMGRWLSLQLADIHGICLNMRFPFPREIIEEILSALLPEWREATACRRDTMAWRIFRLLEKTRDDSRFQPIARYLQNGDLLKRVQLADRLASLFDQYIVYRLDWLLAVENGDEPDDWQAILWRHLAMEFNASDEVHIGRAAALLREIDGKRPAPIESLPPRICVFGISSLPPLFLEIFHHYGRFGELHFFLLQPTNQYWGDLLSKKSQARLTQAKRSPVACHFEEGHPLVASLGRQGQDLLNLLIDADFQQSEEREMFQRQDGSSLLHRLQADIFDLADRENEGAGAKIEVDPRDASIQVHSCHGEMREIEALHDQLLDLFENDPRLRPRDVIVMLPDIESYAPYIQAVFGAPEEPRVKIPFSIVDRRQRAACPAIDVWFRLLELAGSRFGASDVLSLLESEPFRNRFGITDRDVNCLRGWMRATGIRWGIDAAHRGEQGLPPISETTWGNGIDQWLLGYAMRDRQNDGAGCFGGIFPFDEIEGGNIGMLNLFVAALDFLFSTRKRLARPRDLSSWCETLTEILENLYGGIDEIALETREIRSAIGTMRHAAKSAGIDEALPLDAIQYFLGKALDEKVSIGGFLSGGVTFCALQPMRAIPARVICLLGMNNDAFPRRSQQLGFDKMRAERRPGDRSAREDDRYLFLETILSARETLIFSYVGQSARDLSEAPPSVLVSELLDHLDRRHAFPGDKSARETLVRRHRLQPFHHDYFIGGRLFSYSNDNAAACRRLINEPEETAPFAPTPLDEPGPEWREVSARRILRFFRNPSEYFLKERLGFRLPADEPPLEDSEMFEMNSLHEYSLKNAALEELLESRERHEWRRLQARGSAPLGAPGRALCDALRKDAEKFATRIHEWIEGRERANRTLDHRIGNFHLVGEIGPFFGDALIIYRPAKLKPKDCVAAWIQHLLACCSARAEGMPPPETVLVSEDDEVIIPSREDAGDRLAELLELYWRGLRRPLPFFPASSWAFASTLKTKGEAAARKEAAGIFIGDPHNDWNRAEVESNPYIRLCWGGPRPREALAADFEEIATKVFVEIDIFCGKKKPARARKPLSHA